MRLTFKEYFEYLTAQHTSRCVMEGEEVLNAGHVISCGITKKTDDSINLYALCVQTSAITSSPHEVQGVLLICRDTSQAKLSVQNMVCTCKAGQGGKCKHVSAVLLYCTRNDVSEFNVISQTDMKCVWAFKKQCVVENYNTLPLLETPCYKSVPSTSKAELEPQLVDKFREMLEISCPQSALTKHKHGRNDIQFSPITPDLEQITTNYQYFEEVLNNSVQSITMLQISTIPVSLNKCCKSVFSTFYTSDISQIIKISLKDNNIWQLERKYRITGSRCYSIYTYKGENWNRKAHNYFWPKPISNVYIKHGLFYEGNARKKYEQTTGCQVQQTGLIISNSNPWLAYSPDGVVMDEDRPNTLLEIKCPYTGKNDTIKNVLLQCKYIEHNNGKVSLKKKHQYYGQVQFGMVLLNVKKCDLILYASYDDTLEIISIPFDEKFAFEMLKTIKHNYFQHMLHTICNNKN